MARASAEERTRRLLAIVPWIAANDGPTVEEVCSRFGITEQDLVGDLEVLRYCGAYPHSPDMLVEADVADGRVWVRYAQFFTRPLRLTSSEALALVASSAALLAVPGTDPEGPLARGLAKLAAALKVDPTEVLEVDLPSLDTDALQTLRDAVAARRKVAIDYYSFSRDEHTTRVVHPLAVYSADGQWYVSADCEAAGGPRLFRIDRIQRVDVLDETFEPPAEVPRTGVFHPRAEDPVVTLELSPAAAWVLDQYPHEGVKEMARGRRRVKIRVSEGVWFERLLLSLGADARVVAGDTEAACRAAKRVLARYRRQ